MKNLAQVVLIGRINVGKSALFNRLTESHKAIVSNVPGTTRDYNLAKISWAGKSFNLIDTGGIDSDLAAASINSLLATKPKPAKTSDPIISAVLNQTKTALRKATLVLLVVDGQAGLLPADKQLALALKKLKLPLILVCNKIDSQKKWQHQVPEFYKLGLGQPLAVSAANGVGTGDLLDAVIKKIKSPRGRPKAEAENPVKPIRVALIGKANVGKSSLVNEILGEERVIVSPVAQTTREPQSTEITYRDYVITLIDTAGLNRANFYNQSIENQASDRSLAIIKHADVVIFLTEAHKRMTRQDSYLAGLIKDAKTGFILIGNKWDLIPERGAKIDKEMLDYYRAFFPYLKFAPLLFTSAKTGRNVEKILDTVIAVWQQRHKQIDEKDLEVVKKNIVSRHFPVQAKGNQKPQIHNIEQTRTNPPVFTVTVGPNQSIHFSYLRYIENQLRQHFDFLGVPLTIRVRALRH